MSQKEPVGGDVVVVEEKIIMDQLAHAWAEVITIIREPNALATLVTNPAHHIADATIVGNQMVSSRD